jgi:hypothetical protein
MTPDTSAYMIAGYVVILCGITVYIGSLIFRNRKIINEFKYRQINSNELANQEEQTHTSNRDQNS